MQKKTRGEQKGRKIINKCTVCTLKYRCAYFVRKAACIYTPKQRNNIKYATRSTDTKEERGSESHDALYRGAKHNYIVQQKHINLDLYAWQLSDISIINESKIFTRNFKNT